MSAASAATLAARFAESLLIDACTISAPSTRTGPIDPETGERELVPGTVRHAGLRCKIQTYEANEATPESGQHLYSVERYRIHVPESTAGIQVNDEAVITASRRPSNVGRRFRIAAIGSDKTYPSALRLQVDEITA